MPDCQQSSSFPIIKRGTKMRGKWWGRNRSTESLKLLPAVKGNHQFWNGADPQHQNSFDNHFHRALLWIGVANPVRGTDCLFGFFLICHWWYMEIELTEEGGNSEKMRKMRSGVRKGSIHFHVGFLTF